MDVLHLHSDRGWWAHRPLPRHNGAPTSPGPANHPADHPADQPTIQPMVGWWGYQPTSQPSSRPTSHLTSQQVTQPSSRPPTNQPTNNPAEPLKTLLSRVHIHEPPKLAALGDGTAHSPRKNTYERLRFRPMSRGPVLGPRPQFLQIPLVFQ